MNEKLAGQRIEKRRQRDYIVMKAPETEQIEKAADSAVKKGQHGKHGDGRQRNVKNQVRSLVFFSLAEVTHF